MFHTKRFALSVAAFIALSAATHAVAKVELSALFSDHMVLQRDIECPVWGTAEPTTVVTVSIDGVVAAETTADTTGAFRLKLPKMSASSTPRTLVVKNGSDSVTLTDVLVGDVWVCSGQSNMEWGLAASDNAQAEIAASDHPAIRLFMVPKIASPMPVPEVNGNWKVCSPQSTPAFSAVGYFFGRKLNAELNIPIGLIHTNWGGTPAESWTPVGTLKTLTDLPIATNMITRREAGEMPGAQQQFEQEQYAYLKAIGKLDEGPGADGVQFAQPELDVSDWKQFTVPGDWTQQGLPNGTYWLRKEIDIPDTLAGQDLTLLLQRVDDLDTTFFNGEKVGETTWRQYQPHNVQRRYVVPGKLVNAGRNVIAIRVYDSGGAGGILGNPDQIIARAGPRTFPLAGEWLMKMESAYQEPADVPALTAPIAPMKLDHPSAPSSLYNGMIHPLRNFGIKGAIWYQGESNAGRAAEYEKLMTALIQSWRVQFEQDDFPFYIVGLANFMARKEDPNAPSGWAGVREAQRQLDRNVNNVDTTVTIDIGDEKDIHPRNKQDVGLRLALVALEETYGKTLVSRGPTFDRADFADGKVVLHFNHVGGGLRAHDGKLESFAIAGDDGVFVWADAAIDGNTVVLSAPTVGEPTRVRYAFADNPKASLFNAEGLPAEPFEARK